MQSINIGNLDPNQLFEVKIKNVNNEEATNTLIDLVINKAFEVLQIEGAIQSEYFLWQENVVVYFRPIGNCRHHYDIIITNDTQFIREILLDRLEDLHYWGDIEYKVKDKALAVSLYEITKLNLENYEGVDEILKVYKNFKYDLGSDLAVGEWREYYSL